MSTRCDRRPAGGPWAADRADAPPASALMRSCRPPSPTDGAGSREARLGDAQASTELGDSDHTAPRRRRRAATAAFSPTAISPRHTPPPSSLLAWLSLFVVALLLAIDMAAAQGTPGLAFGQPRYEVDLRDGSRAGAAVLRLTASSTLSAAPQLQFALDAVASLPTASDGKRLALAADGSAWTTAPHAASPLFILDRDTGWMIAARTLDREALSMHWLRVSVRDRSAPVGTPAAVASVYVHLCDSNDVAPRLTLAPAAGSDSDLLRWTVVGPSTYSLLVQDGGAHAAPPGLLSLAAADRDTGRFGTVAFSIASGNEAGHLTLDPRSGLLATAPGFVFDAETQSAFTLHLIASDSPDPALVDTESLCSFGRVDMLFAVDGSLSVGPTNFALALDFLADLAARFTNVAVYTRIGLLEFSTDAALIVPLSVNDAATLTLAPPANITETTHLLQVAIRSASPSSGSTLLAPLLQAVLDAFAADADVRPRTPAARRAFVLMDGPPQDSPAAHEPLVAALAAADISIDVLAVGTSAAALAAAAPALFAANASAGDPSILASLAVVDSYDQLQASASSSAPSLLSETEERLCPGSLQALCAGPSDVGRAEATVHIVVNNTNDNAPELLGLACTPTDAAFNTTTTASTSCYDSPLLVSEATPVGARILTVQATDADGSLVSPRIDFFVHAIQPSASPAPFRLNRTTGELFVAAPLDREATSSFVLTLRLADTGQPPQQRFVTLPPLHISDINDNRPVLVTSGTGRSSDGDIPFLPSSAGANTTAPPALFFPVNVTLQLSDTFAGTLGTIAATDPDVGTNSRLHFALLPSTLAFFQSDLDMDSASSSTSFPPPAIVDTITPANLNDYLVLNADTGTLTVLRPLTLFNEIYAVELRVQVVIADAGSPLSLNTTVGVALVVVDTNDNVPVFTNPLNVFFAREDALVALPTTLFTLNVEDADPGPNGRIVFDPLRNAVNPAAPLPFAVNASTGAVDLLQPLDRETVDLYIVAATARNPSPGGQSASFSFSLVVLDANDNRPALSSPAQAALLENAPAQTLVSTLVVSDRDAAANGQVTFEIAELYAVADAAQPQAEQQLPATLAESPPGDPIPPFALNLLTGELRSTRPVDREQVALFRLLVALTDRGTPPLTTLVNFTVIVGDEDDSAPFFPPPTTTTVSVAENSPGGTLVVRVTATDPDPSSPAPTYQLLLDPPSLPFVIDPATGDISVASALAEGLQQEPSLFPLLLDGTAGLALTGVSAVTESFTVAMSVQIASGSSGYLVSRRNPAAQPVYSLFYSDSPTAARVLFFYAATSGQTHILSMPLRTAVGASATLSDGLVHQLCLAVDGTALRLMLDGALSFTATLQSPIGDCDPANSACTLQLGQWLSSTGRPGGLLRGVLASLYIFTRQAFDRHPTEADLRASDLDRDAPPTSYTLTVVASDGVRTSSPPAVVVVNLADLNDNQPVFAADQRNVTVPESLSVGAVVVRPDVVDPDLPANQLAGFALLSLQALGGGAGGSGLEVESTPVDTPFALDPDTGVITLNASLDYEQRTAYVLEIGVAETVAAAASAPLDTQTLLVLVDNTNDLPPTLLNPSPSPPAEPSTIVANISEAAPPGTPVLQILAADGDGPALTSLSFVLLDAAAVPFSLDASSGVLRVAAALDRERQARYQLQAQILDGGAPLLRTSVTLDIDLLDVNDRAPVFFGGSGSGGLQLSVAENVPTGTLVATIPLDDGDGNGPAGLTVSLRQTAPAATDVPAAYPLGAFTDLLDFCNLADRSQHSAPFFGGAAGRAVRAGGDLLGGNTFTVAMQFTQRTGTNGTLLLLQSTPPSSSGTTSAQTWLQLTSSAEGIRLTKRSSAGSTETRVLSTLVRGPYNDGTPHNLLLQVVGVSAALLIDGQIAGLGVFSSTFSSCSSGGRSCGLALGGDGFLGRLSLARVYPGVSLAEHPSPLSNLPVFRLCSSAPTSILVAGALDRETLASYELLLTASDGLFTNSTHALVSLLDTNDNAPEFIAPGTTSIVVNETPTRGALVAFVIAVDRDLGDNAAVTYAITGDAAAQAMFAINSATGELRARLPLDFENPAHRRFTVQVTATDSGRPAVQSATLELDVRLADVNDNAPVLLGTANGVFTDPVRVVETLLPGALVATIAATDADAGANGLVHFSLLAGDPTGRFSLDAASGRLTLAQPLDFDAGPQSYALSILASDSAAVAMATLAVLTVEVVNVVDEPPLFVAPAALLALAVDENAAVGTEVLVGIPTSDADVESSPTIRNLPAFALSGADAAAFRIETLSGRLLTAQVLDRETKDRYNFTVTVYDRLKPALRSSAAVSVGVRDTNDQRPRFLQPQPLMLELSEALAVGTEVAVVAASDTDLPGTANARLNIRVEGEGAEHFAVTPIDVVANDSTTQLRVRVVLAQPLDREAAAVLQLQLVAADLGLPVSLEANRSMVVHVLDINDNAPRFAQERLIVRVPENAAVGATVARVQAQDADAPGVNANISYTLVEVVGASSASFPFALDAATGQVRVRAPLDRETQPLHEFVVAADDGYNPRSAVGGTQRVLLVLLDANDNDPMVALSPPAVVFTEGQHVLPMGRGLALSDADVSGLAGAELRLGGGRETRVEPCAAMIDFALQRRVCGGSVFGFGVTRASAWDLGSATSAFAGATLVGDAAFVAPGVLSLGGSGGYARAASLALDTSQPFSLLCWLRVAGGVWGEATAGMRGVVAAQTSSGAAAGGGLPVVHFALSIDEDAGTVDLQYRRAPATSGDEQVAVTMRFQAVVFGGRINASSSNVAGDRPLALVLAVSFPVATLYVDGEAHLPSLAFFSTFDPSTGESVSETRRTARMPFPPVAAAEATVFTVGGGVAGMPTLAGEVGQLHVVHAAATADQVQCLGECREALALNELAVPAKLTVVGDAAQHTLTVTGRASVGVYLGFLSSLMYVNTLDEFSIARRQLAVAVADMDGATPTHTAVQFLVLDVINDHVPQVGTGSGGGSSVSDQPRFAEGGEGVAVFPDGVVSDADTRALVLGANLTVSSMGDAQCAFGLTHSSGCGGRGALDLLASSAASYSIEVGEAVLNGSALLLDGGVLQLAQGAGTQPAFATVAFGRASGLGAAFSLRVDVQGDLTAPRSALTVLRADTGRALFSLAVGASAGGSDSGVGVQLTVGDPRIGTGVTRTLAFVQLGATAVDADSAAFHTVELAVEGGRGVVFLDGRPMVLGSVNGQPAGGVGAVVPLRLASSGGAGIRFLFGTGADLTAAGAATRLSGQLRNARVWLGGGCWVACGDMLTVDPSVVSASGLTVEEELTTDGVLGRLLLRGSAAPSVYQQVLRAVKYAAANTRSLQTGEREVSVTVFDADFDSASASETVVVERVDNQPPEVDLNWSDGPASTGLALGYTEGDGAATLFAWPLLRDRDEGLGSEATIARMEVMLQAVAGEALDGELETLVLTTAGRSVAQASGLLVRLERPVAHRLLVLGTASGETYEAVLRELRYQHRGEALGGSSREVTVKVVDGAGAQSAAATDTLTLTNVNDEPQVEIAPGNAAVLDVSFVEAVVRLDGTFDGGEDVLVVDPAVALVADADGAGETVCLKVGLHVDLGHASAHVDPGEYLQISFEAEDGDGGSGSGSFAGAADGGAVVVTLSSGARMVLNASTLAGLEGTQLEVVGGGATGDTRNATLCGATSLLSPLLRTLRFGSRSAEPVNGTEPRVVMFSVCDQSGACGPERQTRVHIQLRNDRPEVEPRGSTVVFVEGNHTLTGLCLFCAQALAAVRDVDSPLLREMLVEVVAGGGQVRLAEGVVLDSRVEVEQSVDGGQLALSGLAPIAAYQLALNALEFVDESEEPDAGMRRVVVTVVDSENATSLPAVVEVGVQLVNDAPAVVCRSGGLPTPARVRFVEEAAVGTVPVLAPGGGCGMNESVVVQDSDSSRFAAVVVRIEGAGDWASGSEVALLAAGGAGLGVGNVATMVLGVGEAGVVEIEFVFAQPINSSQAATVLEALQYNNTAAEPAPGVRTLSVRVRDDGGAESAPFAGNEVEVVLVNEFAPVFGTAVYDAGVLREDAAAGTLVAVVEANDADGHRDGLVVYSLGPHMQISVVGGDGGDVAASNAADLTAELFAIDQLSGEIRVANASAGGDAPIDREALMRLAGVEPTAANASLLAVRLHVNVTATDGRGRTGAALLVVVVGDVNDNAPQLRVAEGLTAVREDAAVGTEIGRVAAVDADAGANAAVRLRLVAVDGVAIPDVDPGNASSSTGAGRGLFRMDALTGVVAVNAPLDYETATTHELVFEGADLGAVSQTSAPLTVTVAVVNVNDNTPVVVGGDSIRVNVSESAAVGAAVVQVAARDADGAAPPPEFVLVTGAPHFAVNRTSGLVRVAATLDYETQQSMAVAVAAVDGGSGLLGTLVNISVDVLNENDEPVAIVNGPFVVNVSETLAVGAGGVDLGLVPVVVDGDLPPFDTAFSFRLESANALALELLAVDAASGAVRLVTAPDYERFGAVVQADLVVVSGPASGRAAVTVNIADSNDQAPVLDLDRSDGSGVLTSFAVFVEDADAGAGVALTGAGGPRITDGDTGVADALLLATATLVNPVEAPGVEGLFVADAAGVTTATGVGVAVSADGLQVTLTGPATRAAFEQALAAVRYTNTADEPQQAGVARQVSFLVNDGGLSSLAVVATVAVQLVNDAPEVGVVGVAGSGGGLGLLKETNVTFVETAVVGGTLGLVAAGDAVAVVDSDSTVFVSARARLAAAYDGAFESLTVLGGASSSGLAAVWDARTRTLTLSGAGTAGAYGRVLGRLAYVNAKGSQLSPLERRVEVTVTDAEGASSSPAWVVRVAMVVVNEAPEIDVGSGGAVVEVSGAGHGDPIDIRVYGDDVQVADADSTCIVRLVVVLEGVVDSNFEGLVVGTAGTALAVEYRPEQSELRIEGCAAGDDYERVLITVRYYNDLGLEVGEERVLRMRLSDGIEEVGAGSVRVVGVV